MAKMTLLWLKKSWSCWRTGWRERFGDQRGQSLVIVAFSIMGLLAFIGLGFDLGWVYVERVQVGRATDAAALAAASELPLEPAARERALTYLQENGYDYTDVDHVEYFVDGSRVSGPEGGGADVSIWIDTFYSRDQGLPDTADRIRVKVTQKVPMNFMQFIGFQSVRIGDSAEAENISNIDTVIVYDKSGSMEFDTICYGCWEPSSDPDVQYPEGNIYPLPWASCPSSNPDDCTSNPSVPDHCDSSYGLDRGGSYEAFCASSSYSDFPGDTSYRVNDCNYQRKSTGRYYVVIEAEEYSDINVMYDSWAYTPYYTFWVMQRNDYNDYHNRDVDAWGRDVRGAYLSHHPYRRYQDNGLGVGCSYNDLLNGEYCKRDLPAGGPYRAPRADYDFYVPSNGNYIVWIRGQGGYDSYQRYIHWGIDGTVRGREDGFDRGAFYDGARQWDWGWQRLSTGSGDTSHYETGLSEGVHTLNLWAGGAGFDVDRIVITNDSNWSLPDRVRSSGIPPNGGRTYLACHPCDPRFGGRPGGAVECSGGGCVYRPDCSGIPYPDQTKDPLYDDEQPIRSALEAAKHFVARLDPRFDQVGYVRYSTRSEVVNKLECLRRRGVQDLGEPDCNPAYSDPGDEPPTDPDCGCFARTITNTVLYELDQTHASGSTNIAEGMMDGLEVLSTSGNQYGRPGAAHIMILMTDGEANTHSGCDSACDDDPDLWPDGDADKDCVVWYARQARDRGVVVYTISLGFGADRELMEHVGELTGGYHRWAPNPDRLDEIFDELYDRIFLRLVE